MKVALTGGGTAGHVIPNLALLPSLAKDGWDVFYVGGKGIERDLAIKNDVKYYEISTGKLRRYFSIENFFDVFKVILGIFQACFILIRNRPQIVFSKGGFVSVPVAIAAYILRIPVVTHESDFTPGLATKILKQFASEVLFSFPETQKYFSKESSQHVGTPIRESLFDGNKARGLKHCGFLLDDPRPIVMIMGGSLGAKRINDVVYSCLDDLIKDYRVIHLTGKGKLEADNIENSYVAFEFVSEELSDIFACTDLVVARAGANSIFEFLALKIPMLLIPLEVGSRGDQVHNAKSFVDQGFALSLSEKELNNQVFKKFLAELQQKSSSIRENQELFSSGNAVHNIMKTITKHC